MVAAVYDWSGFYVGVNGGWGSSRKCWDFHHVLGAFVAAAKAATMRPAAPSAARSAIAGRLGSWVFGLEAQGNWADFQRLARQPRSFPAHHQPHHGRRLRPVHRPDRLRLEQALLYVKGGAAVTADRYRSYFTGHRRSSPNSRRRNPLGRRGRRRPGIRLRAELVGRARVRPHVHGTRPTPSRQRSRRRACHAVATIASVRTSIWSPPASTTAGVARSSRSTDRLDSIRIHYERPASRRPFCLCIT